MANTNPPDEIDNCPAPTNRVIKTPYTRAFKKQVGNAYGKTVEE